jgi:Fe-S cluster assembly protein SufD
MSAAVADSRFVPPEPGFEPWVEGFRGLDGGAPEWLRRLRREGFERFLALGFPTTRVEDWKYTDVSEIARRAFRVAEGPPPSATDLESLRLGLGTELVFWNGRLVPGASRWSSLPSGVRVGSLAEAIREADGLVREHLGRYAVPDVATFVALNLGFLRDGAFVHLPRGVSLPEPLHLVFVSSPARANEMSCPRILVVLEEGTEATIVESWIGNAEETFLANPVTEVSLGSGASLTHVRVLEETGRIHHVAAVVVRQERSSRLRSHVVTFGASLARIDLETVLDAEEAEANLDGLYVADGTTHVDHHTTIDHRRPGGTSRELYKGILDGRATGVFNGKVYVRPGAAKTDAHQLNKNLLLSDDAEVDTKPQLEIFTDDVKCSHGAAIGRLDEQALFYLRSRGIGADEARALLVRAFANEIVERVPVEVLRGRLREALAGRLAAAREENLG